MEQLAYGRAGTALTVNWCGCKFYILIRTQIQLPDHLYERAKQFAAEREMSLAEVTRRGLELLLERYPPAAGRGPWRLPRVNGGGLKVDLSELRAVAAQDA
ncbi:MAG: hypothetical protein HYV07_07050 [Deltaproteobacteria bacterium]|nr:hypothetical protein [Deltaproteobacteria bacterium]